MNIKELAELMGQPEKDVMAFVNCLKVWTNKGLSIEEAINKHMEQMYKIASYSDRLPKSIVIDTFYP